MGNVCIVISDSHTREHTLESSDNEDASPITTQTSSHGSSHGSSSFTKRWISLSSRRLPSLKKTRYSAPARSLNASVWQRGILLGERCEPPDFSGLILYDEHGNSVQQFPCKSPKLPAHPALPLVM